MSTFKAGTTYKLDAVTILWLQATLSAKFSGEEGVFTVAEVLPSGNAYTDDITSPATTDRCLIPAAVVDQCEELANAS